MGAIGYGGVHSCWGVPLRTWLVVSDAVFNEQRLSCLLYYSISRKVANLYFNSPELV
jgi:hypothetical protein